MRHEPWQNFRLRYADSWGGGAVTVEGQNWVTGKFHRFLVGAEKKKKISQNPSCPVVSKLQKRSQDLNASGWGERGKTGTTRSATAPRKKQGEGEGGCSDGGRGYSTLSDQD